MGKGEGNGDVAWDMHECEQPLLLVVKITIVHMGTYYMHAHHYLNKFQPTRYKLDEYMGMVESSIIEYNRPCQCICPTKRSFGHDYI